MPYLDLLTKVNEYLKQHHMTIGTMYGLIETRE